MVDPTEEGEKRQRLAEECGEDPAEAEWFEGCTPFDP
jgi:hypothetical protein